MPNNSQVKVKKTQVEVHSRIPSISNKIKSVTACKDSLNSRTLNANVVCATCNKCLVEFNHFACVTKMLNDMNARTKKPTVVPISTRKPKSQANKSVATHHKKKVASKSTKQKLQSYYRKLYENTSKAWKWWIERKIPSGYKWVPKMKSNGKSTCFVRDLQGNDLLTDADVPSQQELDLLFSPLYDEFFNAGSNPQDKQPSTIIQSTSPPSTHTYVHAEKNNNDQAEEGEHLQDDEFTNPFCAPTQEEAESSSYNIDGHENGINQWSTKGGGLCCTTRQAKYTLEILHKHGMDKGQSIGTPMATKPKLDADLSGNPVDQTDYRNADHAGCIDSRKSTSGEIQFLGDKLMRTQLQDYGFNNNKIPLYCDSQLAIAFSCNLVQHSRTKHIHTRYHSIKEQVENGIIELYFVRTEYQLADMFTKALPKDRFKYLVRRIGMRCLTPAELEVLAKESA
nr:retrovirus-related Pol polyprotein from transposon TNT 1-94 [Tanacetum cinerariifolium]